MSECHGVVYQIAIFCARELWRRDDYLADVDVWRRCVTCRCVRSIQRSAIETGILREHITSGYGTGLEGDGYRVLGWYDEHDIKTAYRQLDTLLYPESPKQNRVCCNILSLNDKTCECMMVLWMFSAGKCFK